jgi:hypothetical protein
VILVPRHLLNTLQLENFQDYGKNLLNYLEITNNEKMGLIKVDYITPFSQNLK